MDLQTLIVAVIIVAALVYIARRGWRKANSFSKKSGCDSDCGCGK